MVANCFATFLSKYRNFWQEFSQILSISIIIRSAYLRLIAFGLIICSFTFASFSSLFLRCRCLYVPNSGDSSLFACHLLDAFNGFFSQMDEFNAALAWALRVDCSLNRDSEKLWLIRWIAPWAWSLKLEVVFENLSSARLSLSCSKQAKSWPQLWHHLNFRTTITSFATNNGFAVPSTEHRHTLKHEISKERL